MTKTAITAIVTVNQMREIENQIFLEGMPIASLMEKVALLCSQKIIKNYPLNQYFNIGFFIGNGHNGGDGLVIARELFLKGYQVKLYAPLAEKSKDLTKQHLEYATFLHLNFVKNIQDLYHCDVIIDCLFGFGLNREITDTLAEDINCLNQWQKPIISIDLPSGIHSDTGEILGIAVKASTTFCLGLWKLGLFQSSSWEYTGKLKKIDIGIPHHLIIEKLKNSSTINMMTATQVKAILPLPRKINTHKYKQGNLLLICGCQKYAGAALLSGYGANSSGVGMLTMIVPQCLKLLINSNIPSALVLGNQETSEGFMNFQDLDNFDLFKYNVIVFGMGISRDNNIFRLKFLEKLLNTETILIIDADGLNLLADNQFWDILLQRKAPTILTPHEGEFKRLFPDINLTKNRLDGLQKAAEKSNTIILLKGVKTMISNKGKTNWIINEGTSALARGGSGDVLSGLIGGLVAQTDLKSHSIEDVVAVAAWLHQQGGILASKKYTEMGVDGIILTQYINKVIKIVSH